MKNIFAVLVLSALTLSAHAAYDIQLKLAKAGKVIGEGHILVKAGQEGSITKDPQGPNGERVFFEVVANPHTRGIALTVVSGFKNESGSRNIVNKSELIVASGKTVTATVGTLSNPSEKVVLTVTPKTVPDAR